MVDDEQMTIVVLDYTTSSEYRFHVPKDTDVEDFLFNKRNFKHSQIVYMVSDYITLFEEYGIEH